MTLRDKIGLALIGVGALLVILPVGYGFGWVASVALSTAQHGDFSGITIFSAIAGAGVFFIGLAVVGSSK